MTTFILTGLMIGTIAGILGIFYRNILKKPYMIFHPIYKLLKSWVVKSGKITELNEEYGIKPSRNPLYKFLGWLAFPLGFCIYCNTTWIAIILYILYVGNDVLILYTESLTYNNIIDLVIGLLLAIGVQHLIVAIACKWLIHNHPDLDPNFIDYRKEDFLMLPMKETVKEPEVITPIVPEATVKELRHRLKKGYIILQQPDGGPIELWNNMGKTLKQYSTHDVQELYSYLLEHDLLEKN